VTIICTTLPRDIFESELFGYVNGVVSGAATNKARLIENKAENEKLFLDEINELADDTQSKLLRVLEKGVYFKLGDSRERNALFRLITASNKNLTDSANRFRQDLYYRITGVMFDHPCLSDRKKDISLLVEAFLSKSDYAYNKNVHSVSMRAMDALRNHNWPGNFRELK